ncbi:MAG: GNAT family N-acetyltransferase [Candidatus Aminicenantaceae bacterium]
MEVERITTLEGLEEVREAWNELLYSSGQNCIFLTNEWFSSWWKCFSEDNSMKILIFRDERGRVIGIAPLMLNGRILKFIASQEVTDYCDFITAKEIRNEFFKKFLEYVKLNFSEIEKIELINIRHSSPTLAMLPELASGYELTFTCLENGVIPYITLPSSYEEYLSGLDKKDRHELRRKLRRTYSLREIKTLRITERRKLQVHAEDFILFHKKSSPSKAKFWQRKGMTDFFSEIIDSFSLRGWVELNFLFCQGEIIAALLNFTYFNRVYFYNSAYNSNFAWYSPGLFLFDHSLRQAIKEQKKEVNFLRGDERYKYNFGADENSIFKIFLSFKVN